MTGHAEFDSFVDTIAALRAPDGCPWDREQTHVSIAPNMVEEAYEAVQAIEDADTAHILEELGDVLLQVVLQSQIAADNGEFTIDDVCRVINEKMIRRHPHVFGDVQASDANSVLDLWDQVKLQEKAGDAEAEASLLEGVPRNFPALMQAQKISRKVAACGFEWPSVEDVWKKVDEEIGELKEAYALAPKSSNGKIDKGADPQRYEDALLELGDVFFSLVNVARKMGLDSEDALRRTCGKFRERWAFMEGAAAGQGLKLEDMTADEMEELWELSKAIS